MSLRYDKRQKFARLFNMFSQISPSFVNIVNGKKVFVSDLLENSKCENKLPPNNDNYQKDTCAQCYKTIYGRNLRIFVIS